MHPTNLRTARTIPQILALIIAAILVALSLLPLAGCAGFQMGSVVYCAKDDACAVAITKPKAGQGAPTPAQAPAPAATPAGAASAAL